MIFSWAAIYRLTEWLDERDSISDQRESIALRILKLSEEVGEVAQAYIGYTGQNPRKGVTHTWNDVLDELADVAVTALVAMESLAPLEAQEVFQKRIEALLKRVQWKSGGG